ncbi:MAG TPA: ABC transporter permease, partial [Alphaproteobacteria bacterium]|nr:ABC transporter permease [Alphaproteobacteria bacterium]
MTDNTVTPLSHYVSKAPFDPYSVEQTTPEQEKIYLASQWQLMRLKFRRHKVALASAIILTIMYAMILVVEVLAPYNLHSRDVDHI